MLYIQRITPDEVLPTPEWSLDLQCCTMNMTESIHIGSVRNFAHGGFALDSNSA